MSIDSSANLLFNISADPSAAQGNIQAFRGILSKDLGAMGAEFEGWSKKVFGNLTTVSGGFAALAATLAAGAVAAAGAMSAAADKAADYALKIEDGGEKTGIASEDMSKLHYAARMTETRYEALVGGLTKFATTIDKARDSSSQQAAVFHRLGISQREIEAGSKNMLPLFYRVTDAFKEQMTAVERTAVARDLFSRGGAELVEMLKRGSGALREMGDEAARLGLIITEKDIVAAKELKAEMAFLKAQTEAVTLAFGKMSIPLKTDVLVALEGVGKGIKAVMTDWSSLYLGAPGGIANFTKGFLEGTKEAAERIKQNVRAGMAGVGEGLEAPGKEKVKEATADFWGLTNVLEQLRAKSAGAQGEEAKLTQEMAHLQLEVEKATARFIELRAAGQLYPEAIKRETAALAEMSSALSAAGKAQWAKLAEDRIEKQAKEIERELEQEKQRKEAILLVGAELQEKLLAQGERTWQQEEAELDAHIRRMAEGYEQRGALDSDENTAKLTALWQAGYQKLARDRAEATAEKLRALQTEAAQILSGNWTTVERLKWQYDQDLLRFSAVEEAKTLLTKKEGSEREALERQFADNREAAFRRYADEIQALHNSQGWRGVFGQEFAGAIQGNQALLREWSTSTDQAMMMPRVAVEALGDMSKKAFGQFAQGMAQNIAQSVVYGKSTGEAMQSALASVLAGLGAQAIAYAIYSLGLGFLRLAEYSPGSAAQAFQAAAIFGTAGTAALVMGRAIAPSQAGAAAGRAAGSGGDAGSGIGGGAAGGSAAGGGGTRVAIYIQGHVIGPSGIEELTDIINEAVVGRDVRLIATGVKLGGTVAR